MSGVNARGLRNRARRVGRDLKWAHDRVEQEGGPLREHLALHEIFECFTCDAYVSGERTTAEPDPNVPLSGGEHALILACGHERFPTAGYEE